MLNIKKIDYLFHINFFIFNSVNYSLKKILKNLDLLK